MTSACIASQQQVFTASVVIVAAFVISVATVLVALHLRDKRNLRAAESELEGLTPAAMERLTELVIERHYRSMLSDRDQRKLVAKMIRQANAATAL